jgi:hypothetical protein
MPWMRDEISRRLRAEQRRRTWTGALVPAGTPKPPLWAEMSVAERLTAMTRLCRSQWTASGREIITECPRDQWPGEVFEVAATAIESASSPT